MFNCLNYELKLLNEPEYNYYLNKMNSIGIVFYGTL